MRIRSARAGLDGASIERRSTVYAMPSSFSSAPIIRPSTTTFFPTSFAIEFTPGPTLQYRPAPIRIPIANTPTKSARSLLGIERVNQNSVPIKPIAAVTMSRIDNHDANPIPAPIPTHERNTIHDGVTVTFTPRSSPTFPSRQSPSSARQQRTLRRSHRLAPSSQLFLQPHRPQQQ